MAPAENLAAWRKAERERLIAARMAMPAAAHRAASKAIMASLSAHFMPANPGLVGVYWPFRREFDPLPVMRRIIDAGGQVALPVVIRPRHPLEFRHWTAKTPMASGPLGIPHPADGPPVHPTALLIPLVGFDDRGYRLGYGAGFYDRTLAAFPHRPETWGVGFELSRLPTIHPQPHDVPLDYIVTEAGMVRTAS
ncbi:MAG TPA: 5-formyltetrahydrofolate cyclo-ligase [Caulobacteraceae bacterium]|nr:5-formyltetrahydrofolate cyclo-ligase [Caulobacteraceae bacterium]